MPCPIPTRTLAAAALAAAALAALTGCAITTYRPTEPRPGLGPGVMIDVVSVRGAADKAEVLLRTQQPTLIGPVSMSTGDRPSCDSEQSLPVGHDALVAPGTHAPRSFEINGVETVFVDVGGFHPAGPNQFLDFKVDNGTEQGCMRLPLTAAGDQTLWRASTTPWSLSLGLRLDHPLAPLGGTGMRVTTEARAIRPMGPVRGFFGFTVGVAGCRGADCPPENVISDGDDDPTTGVFGHIGGELGIDRQFPLGRRWALAATLGGNISVFHVGAPADWLGDQVAGVVGPFASLTLFGLGSYDAAIPGFTPEARKMRSGPELFVHHLTAFARGPSESAWVLGFGWRIEGTN